MKRDIRAKRRAGKKTRPVTLPSYLENGVALLDAMSNAMRLIALDELSRQEQSVGDVSLVLGLSQSATSQHLRILTKAGLLTSRRRSQSVFYSCRSEMVLAFLKVLFELFPIAELSLEEPSPDLEESRFLEMEAVESAT